MLLELPLGQTQRNGSATNYVKLSRAMARHWRRRYPDQAMPKTFFSREADLIRTEMNYTGDWDQATAYTLDIRDQLEDLLVKCHDKNVGFDSRRKVVRAHITISRICYDSEF